MHSLSTENLARADCLGMLGLASDAADPGWFLSSTAQVSATFVAIIGGLLTARTVAATQTRQALRVQARILRAQAVSLGAERDRLEQELLMDDAVPWLREVAYGIAADPAAATVRDAVAAVEVNRSAEELAPVFERATAIVTAALAELEGAFVPGHPPPPDLEDIVDLEDMDDLTLACWWGTYAYLTNKLAEAPSMFLIIPMSPTPPDEAPFEIKVDDRRARREKEARSDDLRTSQAVIAQQLIELDEELDRPPLVAAGWAVAALTALFFGGVLLPLILLARGSTSLSPTTTWSTFGCASAGLVAVCAYAVYASAGRSKDVRSDTPAPNQQDGPDGRPEADAGTAR